MEPVNVIPAADLSQGSVGTGGVGAPGTENNDLPEAEGVSHETPAAPAGETPPAAPAVSKQQLELSPESLRALATAMQPKPATPEQKPMTQEEIDRILGVYNVADKDVEELGLPLTALPALQRILDAKMKQAMTAAAVQVEYVKRSLQQQLEPLTRMMQERQTQELVTAFYKQNADLVGKETLVESVYAKLEASGALKGMTKEQAFKAVSENTREVIKLVAGSGNGNENTSPAPTTGRKMSTTLVGGQGGGSGGKSAPVSEQQALAQKLFPRHK